MLLGSVSVSLSWMLNIRIETKYDTIPARLLVAFLAFVQPLGRGWARYFTWLKFKRTPARVIATPEPGIPREAPGGGDSVTYSKPTFYKGQQDEGGDQPGYIQNVARGSVSGPRDWTQSNNESYGPGWNMPGVEGNTPVPGSGQYTTDGQDGSGHVLYGGWLKGSRPGSHSHVAGSGPGT